MKTTRTGGTLAGLVATVALLFVVMIGVGFGMGWVSVSDNPDKSTIEIDKVQVKEDTDKAADATKEFINKSAESLERATDDLEQSADELEQSTDDQTSPDGPDAK